MIARCLCALLFVATLARAVPQFVGVLVSGQETCFALREDATHPGRWLRTGETIAGYTLVSFDARADTLVVENAGLRTTLHLEGSRISGPPLERLRALALQAVAEREGWISAVRCHEPELKGSEIRVLVSREIAGRNEARMVILAPDGRVLDCWKV